METAGRPTVAEVVTREVEEHLRETLRDKVFRTVIRQNVSLAEAPARR